MTGETLITLKDDSMVADKLADYPFTSPEIVVELVESNLVVTNYVVHLI